MATSIKRRSGHGVQEEFEGGVNAALVAPDADQEVHGDQRNFPEDEEQEEIERAEDANQSKFKQQQERKELFDVLVDGLPRHQHAERRKKGGEHHQPQADAVHARRDN